MNEGQLIAYECLSCGTTMFPRHTRCRACMKSTEFREVQLSEGRVVTHTRLTATRPGFPKELRLAVVEFSGGVRVLGQLVGDQEVKTDARAQVSWGQLSEKDGKAVNGFKFVLNA